MTFHTKLNKHRDNIITIVNSLNEILCAYLNKSWGIVVTEVKNGNPMFLWVLRVSVLLIEPLIFATHFRIIVYTNFKHIQNNKKKLLKRIKLLVFITKLETILAIILLHAIILFIIFFFFSEIKQDQKSE